VARTSHRTEAALALIFAGAGLIVLANASLLPPAWERFFVFAVLLIMAAALYARFAHRADDARSQNRTPY
jgi:membrane protein implicated in regulation of membrane protease activity